MKIYHSCSILGAYGLFKNYDGGTICVSTDASTHLFGREAVLVWEIDNPNFSEYSHVDLNAKKNLGWDEARIKLSDLPSQPCLFLEKWQYDRFSKWQECECEEKFEYEEEEKFENLISLWEDREIEGVFFPQSKEEEMFLFGKSYSDF